jgi:hypothetical protein
MKTLFCLVPFLFVIASKENCHRSKKETATYKGRLEIKGNCMNYTIKLLAGNIDTSLIDSKWTDEMTNKSYLNVFALGSRCSFPSTIQQGDEFLFKIDTATLQNCAVCLAYYPTPSKRLSIKVIDK